MFRIGQGRLRLGRGLQFRRGQVELERGEVLLRAIVQLALDAAALAGEGIDKRGTRGRQLLGRGAQCQLSQRG